MALWLPESLAPDMPRAPLRGALRRYWKLLGDGVFIGYALTGGLVMGGMFAYISGSPFVFIQLYGVPAEHYGWLFGANALGFIITGQINARLLILRGPDFWLRRAVWIYLVCGLVLLGLSALRPAELWPLLIPLFLCIASLGGILPNASACAMAGQGHNAGSASGLLGSLQFCIAAGASALVGLLHDSTAMPMAEAISLCGIAAVAMALLTHRLELRQALR
ncbi:Bicyclomycin resistance protein [compost metagenome]